MPAGGGGCCRSVGCFSSCAGDRARLDRDAGNRAESRNPLDRRSRAACTDWPWCLALLAFVAGLLVVAGFAFSMGDLQRIFSPFDCYGNTCGSSRNLRVPGVPHSGRDTSRQPYLFHFSDLFATNTLSVCVSRCPLRPMSSLDDLKLAAARDNVSYCDYDFPVAAANATHQNKYTGPCPDTPISRMEPVFGRCITAGIRTTILPNDTHNWWKLNNVFGYLNLTPLFSRLLSDLYSVWLVLLCMFLLSGLLSAVLIAGVWLFPRLAGHAMLIGCASLCGCATALLWWVYADQKRQLDAKEASNFPLLDVEAHNEDAFLSLSVICSVLLLALLLCLKILCARVRYVGPLFSQAAQCVAAVPQLCALPLVTCALLGGLFTLWLWTLAFIATSALPRTEPRAIPSLTANGTLRSDPIAACLAMDRPSWVSWLWLYHVAGLLWLGEFALACQQYLLGRVCCDWYYRDQRHSTRWPLASALADLLFRRLGTVAVGSLVIATTRLPRWALVWAHKRLRNRKGCGPGACCVRCRRLNKSALAAAGLTGQSFWAAAGTACDLLGNKQAALRLAALNSAGDFVLLTAKLAVSAACTIVCTVLLLLKWSDKSIRFFALPIVLVATFSFLVAHCFLSVFEFVIDALFICFSYDLSSNDGTPGREQFMSEELKSLVFDTCDALTNNAAAPRHLAANSRRRRQPTPTPPKSAEAAAAAAASVSTFQENGGAAAAAVAADDEAAARLRISELDEDPLGDVPDDAGDVRLVPLTLTTSSSAPTACQEADDDLNFQTPIHSPMRAVGTA